MRRVHVDHDQAFGVFGQDVDAVQLRDGITERRNTAVLRSCRQPGAGHARHACRLLRTAGRRRVQRAVGGARLVHTQSQRRLRRRPARVVVAATAAARCVAVVRNTAASNVAQPASGRPWVAGTIAADTVWRDAGTGMRQGILQGAIDEIVDQPRFAEAHLVFGRVHIDVHACRVQLQKQHIRRLTAMKQHIAVGHLHRMRHAAVPDRTAVDVEVLLVGAGTRVMRLRNPAVQAQTGAAVVHAQGLARKIVAEGFAQPRVRIQIARLVPPRRLAVVRDAQFHIRPRQCQRTQPLFDMAEFGAFGTQKFAPRRHVEEQFAHFDRGARRMRARHHLAQATAVDFQCGAVLGVVATRGQGKAADRGDRRQGFAAKAQRGDGFQVVQRSDLAGGMPRHGQRQFVRGDAAPLSRMRISRTPPSSSSISTRVAPASSAFSTSSLTTDAGRSTTSPAAIWLIRISGSWRIAISARSIAARAKRGRSAV